MHLPRAPVLAKVLCVGDALGSGRVELSGPLLVLEIDQSLNPPAHSSRRIAY